MSFGREDQVVYAGNYARIVKVSKARKAGAYQYLIACFGDIFYVAADEIKAPSEREKIFFANKVVRQLTNCSKFKARKKTNNVLKINKFCKNF